VRESEVRESEVQEKQDKKEQKEQEEQKKESVTYPTPYVLSTITATGSIGCHIDLKSFYYFIEVDDITDESIKRHGYTYIEWGRKNDRTFCKGFHKKMMVHHKTKQEGKRFDKQITLVLRKYEADKDGYLYQNLKVFFNGSIQITGLKSVEQGPWALQFVLDTVRKMQEVKPEAVTNYTADDFGENAMKVHDYKIQLINTDFRLGYDVNRRILDQKLSEYGLYHVFEAGHYPGVKISFYWSPTKASHEQNGICTCPDQTCMRRTKTTLADADSCRKVTVIVFQSGSVIITGAMSIEQVNDAYNKMVHIFREIEGDIKKTTIRRTVSKKYPKFSYDSLNIKRKIRMPKNYVHENENIENSDKFNIEKKVPEMKDVAIQSGI